jgi:hypothetical protein
LQKQVFKRFVKHVSPVQSGQNTNERGNSEEAKENRNNNSSNSNSNSQTGADKPKKENQGKK